MRQNDDFGQMYFQLQNERNLHEAGSCVWDEDGKEKNTGTEQKKKEKESRPEKSPQPSGNGGVFP